MVTPRTKLYWCVLSFTLLLTIVGMKPTFGQPEPDGLPLPSEEELAQPSEPTTTESETSREEIDSVEEYTDTTSGVESPNGNPVTQTQPSTSSRGYTYRRFKYQEFQSNEKYTYQEPTESQQQLIRDSSEVRELANQMQRTISQTTGQLTGFTPPDITRLARAIVSGIVGNSARAFQLASQEIDGVTGEIEGQPPTSESDIRRQEIEQILSEEGFASAIINSVLEEYLKLNISQLNSVGIVNRLEEVTSEILSTELENLKGKSLEELESFLQEKIPHHAQDIMKLANDLKSLKINETIRQLESTTLSTSFNSSVPDSADEIEVASSRVIDQRSIRLK